MSYDHDPLPRAFYARDTLSVAHDLLGCVIEKDGIRLTIIETEGYLPDDSACHAYRGRTPRTEVMFGPPGHAYVYLCYGIHHLLNFVTERDGVPGAVLVRAAVVESGHALVQQRRGGRLDCRGPGKVGQALAVDTSWSGRALHGPLAVLPGSLPGPILRGPRVGIDYALPEHRDAPWRFQVRV